MFAYRELNGGTIVRKGRPTQISTRRKEASISVCLEENYKLEETKSTIPKSWASRSLGSRLRRCRGSCVEWVRV